MKLINSFFFAFVSAGMLVVVQNLHSFLMEFVLLFIAASLVQLGAKEYPWLATLLVMPKAVANLKKRRESHANESLKTEEEPKVDADYPTPTVADEALTLGTEEATIDEQGEKTEKVETESVSEDVNPSLPEDEDVSEDSWLKQVIKIHATANEQPVNASEESVAVQTQLESTPQEEILVDEGTDTEVGETEGVSIQEPVVLEAAPVTQEVEPQEAGVSHADNSLDGEILSDTEILEKLKGLSTTKGWHRVFDELKVRGYSLPVSDRKTSSQKSRALLLSRYGVQKGDMEVARQAALQFLQSQTARSHKATS